VRGLLPIGAILAGVAALIAVNIVFALDTIDISADFTGMSAETVSSLVDQSASPHLTPDIGPVAGLDRPLFSPTRRQFVPAPIEEVATPSPVEVVEAIPEVSTMRPEIELKGTRRIGSSFAALVHEEATATYSWITAGEVLQGWRVERVGEAELVLTSSGSSVVYSLYPRESDATP